MQPTAAPTPTAPEYSDLATARAALVTLGPDYVLCGGIDQPYRLLHCSALPTYEPTGFDAPAFEEAAPLTTSDMSSLMVEVARAYPVYEGGDDGPIREPGDDVPSFGDVYNTPEEFAQLLDKHSDRLVKIGLYDIAGDLSVAAQKIAEQADQLEVARDKVAELINEIKAYRAEIRDRDRGGR